jgi:hypothetical protein
MPERRYQRFRSAYGNFARTGDARSARVALGHYARTVAGGAKVGSARIARAARTGGAVLASFASSGAAVTARVVGFNIRALAGQPLEIAIARIIGEFCPPGILDEEVARIAIGEALAIALEGADVFDPDAIDDEAVRIATLSFVAELVFLEVASVGGNALAQAPNPAAAVERESQLRELIREVADDVGSPVLARTPEFTPASLSGLVTRLVVLVNRELAKW